MSIRKYRLAAPIKDDKTDALHRSEAPPLPVWLPRSNNVRTNSRKPFLHSKQIIEKAKPFTPPARWWIVLPLLLLTVFVAAGDPLITNDLIVRRYERQYGLDASPNTQRQVCRQSATTSIPTYYRQYPPYHRQLWQRQSDYILVQRAAAKFHTKISIASLIPGFLSFILLGSNCDTIGRRPLLILPLVGKVIWHSLMLIIVSRDLSDTWLLIAHAIEASVGSSGLVLLSAFAYITDCTVGSLRTRAFLITEGTAFLIRVVPILAVGVWLRFYLYTVPLSVCLGFSVVALLYALFIQPESVESVRNLSLIRQLARIRLKPIIGIVTVYTVKRSNGKQQRLAIITIILILLQMMLFGYLTIFSLYLYGQPLCLDALNVSLISSVQAIVVFLLSILTAVCKKSFERTYWSPALGALAFIVNLIILSLAKRIWLVYIASCIGGLFFITLPVLRSKLTRMIEVDEYAIVFIGAGVIEVLGYSALGIAGNSIYNATVNFFPGLVFIVFAIVGVFPIALMGYLAFLERRASKNTDVEAMPAGIEEM